MALSVVVEVAENVFSLSFPGRKGAGPTGKRLLIIAACVCLWSVQPDVPMFNLAIECPPLPDNILSRL
jgi:hypothetical protein